MLNFEINWSEFSLCKSYYMNICIVKGRRWSKLTHSLYLMTRFDVLAVILYSWFSYWYIILSFDVETKGKKLDQSKINQWSIQRWPSIPFPLLSLLLLSTLALLPILWVHRQMKFRMILDQGLGVFSCNLTKSWKRMSMQNPIHFQFFFCFVFLLRISDY